MAPHSSTLAWKIPWAEEPGGLQSMGLRRVGHDWATSLSLFTFMNWGRKCRPTRVLAWRIPGTGEPGGLPSMGSHRVGHDWCDLAAAAAIYYIALNFCALKSLLPAFNGLSSYGKSLSFLFPVWIFLYWFFSLPACSFPVCIQSATALEISGHSS